MAHTLEDLITHAKYKQELKNKDLKNSVKQLYQGLLHMCQTRMNELNVTKAGSRFERVTGGRAGNIGYIRADTSKWLA